MSTELAGKTVLVTGVGIKLLEATFTDITTGKPSHTPVLHEGTEYKANIGATVALECARAGAAVHMVARTEEKLRIVEQWVKGEVPGAVVSHSAVDLGDLAALGRLVESLPKDGALYWVQSVGLGAGTVQLKDDNPYLPIDDISEELVEAELSVLRNTISLLQLLLPRFRRQEETRVCVISSMSAVRSFRSGSIHNAAKGAISRSRTPRSTAIRAPATSRAASSP